MVMEERLIRKEEGKCFMQNDQGVCTKGGTNLELIG